MPYNNKSFRDTKGGANNPMVWIGIGIIAVLLGMLLKLKVLVFAGLGFIISALYVNKVDFGSMTSRFTEHKGDNSNDVENYRRKMQAKEEKAKIKEQYKANQRNRKRAAREEKERYKEHREAQLEAKAAYNNDNNQNGNTNYDYSNTDDFSNSIEPFTANDFVYEPDGAGRSLGEFSKPKQDNTAKQCVDDSDRTSANSKKTFAETFAQVKKQYTTDLNKTYVSMPEQQNVQPMNVFGSNNQSNSAINKNKVMKKENQFLFIKFDGKDVLICNKDILNVMINCGKLQELSDKDVNRVIGKITYNEYLIEHQGVLIPRSLVQEIGATSRAVFFFLCTNKQYQIPVKTGNPDDAKEIANIIAKELLGKSALTEQQQLAVQNRKMERAYKTIINQMEHKTFDPYDFLLQNRRKQANEV